jgi:drug/metabolite transporter (DMT)-like permease
VVAVILGYFLGGEALSLRTIVGVVFVLVSVVSITTTPAKKLVTTEREANEARLVESE